MINRFRRELTIAGVCLSILIVFLLSNFFVNGLHFKIATCEQENESLTEQFANKSEKLNKQFVMIKDENRNIKIYNQDLQQKLEQFKYVEHDIRKKLDKIKEQKVQLEKTYSSENNSLQHQLKNLHKENIELHALIKELQLQIKNYKVNSYGLFQAGKLEVELSDLDQQLVEQYEHINQKKNNIGILKDKCGKLRINSKFCKEYDSSVNTITLLEKQLEHLQNKREDLKQRINVYLSSSVQTNPH